MKKNISVEKFMTDETLKRAAVRSFEIIGEASRHLPEEFRAKRPSVDWKQMAGFRNVLIHTYMDVDYSIVWRIMNEKIPELQLKIQEVIAEENKNNFHA